MSSNKFCDNSKNSNVVLACACVCTTNLLVWVSCSHQNSNLFEIRRNWLGRCSSTENHVCCTVIGNAVPVETFPLGDVDRIVCSYVLPQCTQSNDNELILHRNGYRCLFTSSSYSNNTFNIMTELNSVDNHYKQIPLYSPLVNNETKECFWKRKPSAFFTGGDELFSKRSFYNRKNQDNLLKHINRKADDMHHKCLGKLDYVNDLERALAEYYNVAKRDIVRINEPVNDAEWSTVKFLLDTSRILLLNGLLTVKQYVPIQTEDDIVCDEDCLSVYLVSMILHDYDIVLVLRTILSCEI